MAERQHHAAHYKLCGLVLNRGVYGLPVVIGGDYCKPVPVQWSKGDVSHHAGLPHVDADRAGCITSTAFYFNAVHTARGIGLWDNGRRYQPQRQQ